MPSVFFLPCARACVRDVDARVLYGDSLHPRVLPRRLQTRLVVLHGDGDRAVRGPSRASPWCIYAGTSVAIVSSCSAPCCCCTPARRSLPNLERSRNLAEAFSKIERGGILSTVVQLV